MSLSSISQFVRLGLTNRDSLDVASYAQTEPRVSEAYCTSRKCANTLLPRGIKKNVPFSATDCPDCKSALRWRRVPASMGIV